MKSLSFGVFSTKRADPCLAGCRIPCDFQKDLLLLKKEQAHELFNPNPGSCLLLRYLGVGLKPDGSISSYNPNRDTH